MAEIDMASSRQRDDARAWLSPVTLQVLLSLADGDRHGYAIKQEIQERTHGTVILAVGTLYEALYRLERFGAVRATSSSDGASGGAPRRTYQLTGAGRRLLQAEIARLDAVLAQARQKNIGALSS